MHRPMILAYAVAAALAAVPAQAAWLQCTAAGSNASGAFSYHTTVANVGKLGAPRLAALQLRLVAYVGRVDPDAHAVRAACAGFDDQETAITHYSAALDAASRRLGWDHVTVVAPESWLADTDIVDDPLRP